MAEETKQPNEELQGQVPPAEAPKPETDNKPPDTWDAVYKSDRFKQLLAQKKAAEAELAELADAETKAEEERLATQQKWQELAEKREGELSIAQGEIDALKMAQLRQKIANEAGLPAPLAARLQGDTEEALREDAKVLGALIPKEGGFPPTPQPKKVPDISDEDRRRRAFSPRL